MDSKKSTIQRPPVVVVMGHIDHGKSKLLDYIRSANIVEKEAGGITQHIGAYETDVKCESNHPHKTRRITFLDTPGHEAFSQMRVRGARIADVAVLVVAAEDGPKPQTIEAHKAIQQSGIPFVVAINKIDKPDANPEIVKAKLAENQIFVENYGGSVPCVNISAKTGQGVNELLDIILLLSDLEDLSADPEEPATGFVIESDLDPKRGTSSTLLIQNGTLRMGDFVAAGGGVAPVRIFEDFMGKRLKEATFSSPVKITGFSKIPQVGAEFRTFKNKKEAEAAANDFGSKAADNKPKAEARDLSKTTIPVVIKSDVYGSLEAVEKEIKKLEDDQISINILRTGTGNIGEEDVKISSGADNSIVLGFNVGIDPAAKILAERFNALIYTAKIIYEISDWLKTEIEKRRPRTEKDEVVGSAKILKIFNRDKNRQVLGARVLEGKATITNGGIKIKRQENEIGQGKIAGMQHNRVAVKEVEKGNEFGVMIDAKIELAPGDVIEIIEKVS